MWPPGCRPPGIVPANGVRCDLAVMERSVQDGCVRSPLLIATLLACLVGCAEIATPQETSSQGHNAAISLEKVDINHATVQELMQVPGITRVWAERIVRYRPYRGKNQLLLDGIVPGDVYLRIKDHVIAHRHPH